MSEPAVDQPARRTCPLTTQQLVDLIMLFVEKYNAAAQIELYEYQLKAMRRIVKSLLVHDGATITGLWSRQSGKSEMISSLAGALCVFLPVLGKAWPDDDRVGDYCVGFKVGIFAPRLQQSGIIYERIRTRAESKASLDLYSDPEIGIRITQSRGDQVSWSNGSFVSSSTASDQTNVEGRTFHMVILDEAQLISASKLDKEIRPMLASTNGTCVQIGTVHYKKGTFRNQIDLNNENYAKGLSEQNHFQFDYEVVIAQKRAKYEETKRGFHLAYEKFVAGELERLRGNKDNEEFRMNFRLLWQDTQKLTVDPDCFEDAADPTIDKGTILLSRRRVGGLDFGKKIDESILTVNEIGERIEYSIQMTAHDTEPKIFHEKCFVDWKVFHGRWQQQIEQIVTYCREMQLDVLVCDATGVGDPLTEQLQDLMPGVLVVPWLFSSQGKDRIYKHYVVEVESCRQRYAASEHTKQTDEYQAFVQQHGVLEKNYVGPYLVPSAAEGHHDDYCDSGALACWASELSPSEDNLVECQQNMLYEDAAQQRGYSADRSERYRNRRAS